MDITALNKHGRKFILVYKEDKKVLDDYIRSLKLFDTCIELSQFSIPKFLQNDYIYVFTQMWFRPGIPETRELIKNPRFIFLNVENLTERYRFEHMTNFIDSGTKIADYSTSNIKIMNDYIQTKCPEYPHRLIHLPYQFNLNDFCNLYNADHEYDYDVGIVNAYITPSDSVDSSVEYRRNQFWELIQKQSGWKCINIMGWNKERDDIIRRCKVIINIHVFSCFRIFQHIRCDRLIFANKIIVSDISLFGESLDIYDHVTWRPFDSIIQATNDILTHFDAMQYRIEHTPKRTISDNRHNALQEVIDDLCDKNSK